MHFNDYVKHFMTFYSYPQEAIDVLSVVEQRLDDEKDFGEAFDKICDEFTSGKTEFNDCLKLLDKVADDFKVDERTIKFVFIMNMSEWTREQYKIKGIPDEVFVETFDDLRSKLLECMECENTVGTFVPHWYDDFLNVRIFKYGRFEYQYGDYNRDNDYVSPCGVKITKGDFMLGLHIPSAGPSLSDEVRYDSYKKAYEAFKGLFPDGKMKLQCGSWLLYDNHRKFLPAKSNILRFMDDFDLIDSTETEDFNNDWRIFGHYSDLPVEQMPGDTSLRKAYRDWLLGGGKAGHGYGIIIFDGEKIINNNK